ncbi:MAG: tRNA preQ1(34) S-adenosylmethionine ribosyltransferase-isomerase QueA [Fervidobacterium sp.]|nr:tRNA preQ1(34) S-adenosylmethionine ribosyltransferase-isomerase QueA [Fervidobacterium gondwanense]UXF00174.1 S-adenosylmethionine tRNA ribosyltransferase [Fervidobacterium riparium]
MENSKLYKLDAYDYFLPEELIAQQPIEPRDHSRLMVLDRTTGNIQHRMFKDILEYLSPKDILVFNTSKVIPARIYGKKTTGATVELLLLEKMSLGVWKCLVKPGKAVKEGTEIVFHKPDGNIIGKCVGRAEEGTRIIEFSVSDDHIIFSLGKIPLPHYIKNENIEFERYQTVYAKHEGSVAAPTAGLHFTNELLEKIKSKGVRTAEVILHVGIGTFRPVKAEDIRHHKMHEEYYIVPEETVNLIDEVKSTNGRVIAVGTTSVRTLETIARQPKSGSYSGKTDIFIYPPFEFKIVDALITNFHLPKSSLIMLVSAFAGYELTMQAYKIAVEEKYRFFSFGDAMFIF